jgi:antitoxin (DNA-binding transcriptional repressor) of toxin-antitoxin stability system
MKTATVADLRNNFRRISSWIEHGETVQIVKRGRLFAHLTAAISPIEDNQIPKVDFLAQLREIWGGRVFSEAEVLAMREAELDGEEG